MDGSALDPGQEYDLEYAFLYDAEQVQAEAMIASIAEPSAVTVVYGMNDENLSALAQEYAAEYDEVEVDAYIYGVASTTYYNDMLETLCFVLSLWRCCSQSGGGLISAR